MSDYPDTPELDKMIKVQEKSQEIGSFLDWLNKEEGVCLMVKRENYPGYKEWSHIGRDYKKLIADYFGVNLKKVDEEKRKIFEWIDE